MLTIENISALVTILLSSNVSSGVFWKITNIKLGKRKHLCFQTWALTSTQTFPFALNDQKKDFQVCFLILQCRCTARDLERMAEIIESKLGVQMSSQPANGLAFIRLFYYIFRNAANELGLSDFYNSAIVLSDLEQKMEILACDASCASIRPSELALVMLCTRMDASVSTLEAGSQQIHGLVDYAIQLQKLCRVSFHAMKIDSRN